MGIIKADDLVFDYIRRDEEGNVENVTEGTGIANDQRFFEPAHEQGGDRICIDFWLEYMLVVEQLGQSR